MGIDNNHGDKPLILIVEDDRDMATLNARMLKRRGYETLTAYSAAEARALGAGNDVDLFVLDITLPDGDGLSLCREFRLKTDAPVLFLTGKKESQDKVAGLDTGGDYYLTKPYDGNELLAVIQSLLRRAEHSQKKLVEASVITRGPLAIKLNENKAYINGRDAELTQKEFALLLLLVQNEDRELSYKEIYMSIWGISIINDSSALRQLMSRLKKKLGEDDSDDFFIRNEQRKGYMFSVR